MEQVISNLEGSLVTIQLGMIRLKNNLLRETNPARRELDVQEMLSLVINMELLTKAIQELKDARDYRNPWE